MALLPRSLRGLFIGLFGIFVVFGTSMTIIGAALPRILGDFSWSYAAAGAVIAASAAAYFPATLAAGKIVPRLGIKTTMLLALGLCAVGLAFFALSRSIALNLALNVLVGLGQGLLDPTVNMAMLKMDQEGSGKPMSLMHGAFAVGAVAGPIALGAIIAWGLPWAMVFRASALLFALLAIIVAFLPFSRLGERLGGGLEEPGGRSRGAVAGRPGSARPRRGTAFYLGFASLLLYVGVEVGISNWIAEYFVRIFSAPAAFAPLTVSIFWIGLLAGRFGVPVLYRGKRPEAVLVASSLLLVVAATALCALGFAIPGSAGGAAATAAWAGLALPSAVTFLAGLGCSIVYPTVMSLVGTACEDSQAEAIAFAAAGGGFGLFVFPFLMAWIAQAFGIRTGFASYALVSFLTALSCAALANAVATPRKGKTAI
jgi:fucose permease